MYAGMGARSAMSLCIHEVDEATCDLCRPRSLTPITDVYCRQGCGHPLTNPVSRSFGVGPRCFGKDRVAQEQLDDALNGITAGHWLALGPLTQQAANNWATAFRELGGLAVHTRTDVEGTLKIYVRPE